MKKMGTENKAGILVASLTEALLRSYIRESLLREQQININDRTLDVEVASEPSDIRNGLMHRDSIPSDGGMLFVFPDSAERSFYMKNTKIPLSIAFADPDGTINTIKPMDPFDETSVTSDSPSKFALEMNQGWFDSNDVCVGDKIKR